MARLRAAGCVWAEDEAKTLADCLAPFDLEPALRRREAGEPLAHILGSTEFDGLQLQIGPGVFVPRPRAEAILHCVLGQPSRVLDLGCGCGALAAALKKRLPQAEVQAADLDQRALHFARLNGQKYGFQVHRSDWLRDVPGQFDLIVAYFPHVPTPEREQLDQDYLRAEGEHTVLGGSDGLDPLRAVLPQLAGHGRLVTLLQTQQVAWARRLACELTELGGDEHDRVVQIRYLPALRDSK